MPSGPSTRPAAWRLRYSVVMHIPGYLIAGWIEVLAALLLLLSLGTALRRASWMALRQQPTRMHLVAGGAVACLLLWLLNIHLVDGMIVHFLGLTTLTLLVGWSFAVLGGSLVLLGFFALQGLEWSDYPLSVCLTVIIPATVSRALASWLYRPSLQHPFVYILGAGFAGGALVTLVLGLLALGMFWVSGVDGYVDGAAQWWPLVFLLMFSEGFINGMCVSALAIFYPHWLKTFDDRFYLDDA